MEEFEAPILFVLIEGIEYLIKIIQVLCEPRSRRRGNIYLFWQILPKDEDETIPVGKGGHPTFKS